MSYNFMLKKSEFHRKIRKTHRWLGVVLGVQFLFWTLGGIYFSWSNMDEVKGEDQKAIEIPLNANLNFISPKNIIDKIRLKDSAAYLIDLKIIQILNKPFYQITYSSKDIKVKKIQLADAVSGELRTTLSKNEAIAIAKKSLAKKSTIIKTEFLTATNGHHEYRKQPLPAYAVTLNPENPITVYVASELGTVQKFRNSKWRTYDIFWMLHTMDFETRSNFSNWLLRAFSIFGLLSILSGFVLFFVSRKTKKLRVN